MKAYTQYVERRNAGATTARTLAIHGAFGTSASMHVADGRFKTVSGWGDNMASYSAEVRNELARIVDEQACCKVAELASLMRMGGTMLIGGNSNLGIKFTTENAAVAQIGRASCRERV